MAASKRSEHGNGDPTAKPKSPRHRGGDHVRKRLIPPLALVLIAALGSNARPAEPDKEAHLSRYLPEKSELAGWERFGEPQTARGDDLYLVIDGAAEIFVEYGFREAIFQSYDNGSGKSINLEIYRMADPASAYGIYTFRTGEDGTEIAIGNGARMEDYYLNFWKGSFLVSVIGFDTDEETIGGVKAMAMIVVARIAEEGEKPRLTGALPAADLMPDGIEYLKGNLALVNHYEFDKANIFGVTEGVIGTYGDHRIFLFYYSDETQSRKWFLNGSRHLKRSPRFHEFTGNEDGCAMTDRNGDYLLIEPYRNYIIFALGREKGAKAIMTEQKTAIDRCKR
jgi:hypothetical protein